MGRGFWSGRYAKLRLGESVETENGPAKISRILSYEDIVHELALSGARPSEMLRFAARVEHFLGRKDRYFECELVYPNGDMGRIDWSEYLALKNRLRKKSEDGSKSNHSGGKSVRSVQS